MVKIEIEWDNVRPVLKYVSGILTIYNVPDVLKKYEILLTCRVKRNPHCIGFENVHGYSSEIFKKYEDIMNTLVNAYYDGAILKKSSFHWIDENYNDTHFEGGYINQDG